MAYFQRFPLGSTLVVCTSFIHDEFVDTLNSLRGQGFKIVILYVGNDEYSPMSDGIIVHNIRPYLDKLEEAGEPVTG